MATKKSQTGRRAASSDAKAPRKSSKAASSAKGGAASKAKAKSEKAHPEKSAEATKPASRAKSTSKPKSSTPRRKKSEGVVAKTAEVLDATLAGAVVGAITGAARTLQAEPTAVAAGATTPLSPATETPSTAEVLSELAPGAAAGAVVGAAKAVMPKEKKGGKRKKS